jgi:hypothetical protein
MNNSLELLCSGEWHAKAEPPSKKEDLLWPGNAHKQAFNYYDREPGLSKCTDLPQASSLRKYHL